MPDVAALLKSEIIRLSKKSVREFAGPLQSTLSTQRKQISALKKQVTQLERDVARLQRTQPADDRPSQAESGADTPNVRFVAKGLVTLRKRLDLSAEALGQLVGVSGQSVYNWEQGKAKPRARQLQALAELRGLGKRAARARLDAINGEAGDDTNG